MKELEQLSLPEDLLYTKDHEWARAEGDSVLVGINDYAQDQLGDIVFVEMPDIGDSFKEGEEFGSLESVKAVSELYIPVAGEILAVNEALEDDPALLNRDPYASWIIKIRPESQDALKGLLDSKAYFSVLQGE